MSTSVSRSGTARALDSIGVLAVVIGLLLGLVPGIALPDARADESCDDSGQEFHPRFTFERLRMELSKLSGPGADSLVVDTTDANVTCTAGSGNALYVFVDGVQVETEAGLADSPGFHLSCSISYTNTTMTIGDSTYNTDSMIFDSRGPNNGGEECTPFPSAVTVTKVDEEGRPLVGAQFTLYAGTSTTTMATTSLANPCTTGTDGTCSFGTVTPASYPASYTIDETFVPAGYARLPGLPQTLVLDDDTALAFGPYQNSRVDYEIDVTPDGRNAVGNTHDFVVALERDGAAAAGEVLALSWTGTGAITAVNGGAAAATCLTDTDGQCDVTVSSDAPGSGVLSATFTTPYQNASGDGGVSTDGEAVASISDSADKTWIGYVADIAPSATNLAGDPHTFTATVWETDGTTTAVADGVDVTVTWTGAPDAGISPGLTCTTDATGQCSFTVDSEGSASGTITIVELDGTVLGLDAGDTADDEQLVDTTPTASADGSLSATKTWREYRALIDDDSVNPVGEAHTFEVQVQYSQDGGDSWQAATIPGLRVLWTSGPGAGRDVLDDEATPAIPGSTCDDGTTADGTCTIVVTSASVGSRTVTLESVTGDLLPDDDPNDTGLTYDIADTQYDADAGERRSATKTWLDFGASIGTTGHNQVGEPHTFSIEVFRTGGRDVEPGVADGTRVDVGIEWEQPHDDNEVVSNTCGTVGTVDGVCTVTLGNGVAGRATVTVLGLDDYSFGGVTQDVTFTSQPRASKTWYAYRASIEADGVNLVGDDHPFTVTAEVDDGAGWDPVPAGTTLTVTSSGVGSIDMLTCETEGGTGACVVTVDSSVPGDRVVAVSTVEATATDDPDDTADVAAGTHLEPGQSTSATKTWIEYSAVISGDATNLTGQDHTFRVEAFQDSGSGDRPVPSGTEVGVALSDHSHLVVDGDGCATGTGDDPETVAAETNVCFVTVGSSAVGEVTVTVDTVQAVDVDGAPVARIGGTSATKTWIEVLVTVQADETNIVGEDHVFTIDVDLDTPDGPAEPSSGSVVASTSGVGQEDGQTCDTGLAADGTCTVTVSSTESGDRVVTAESVTFTYDGTTFADIDLDGAVGISADTDPAATKTWLAYRIGIAADGFNAVRDPHTFTVTIEQTASAAPVEADWTAVPDGTTATITVTNGPGSLTRDDCASAGTIDGTCSVVLESDEAGTTTVRASEIAVAHPATGASARVDVADAAATKAWIAFRGSIVDDAVNVTGDDHTFHVNVEYTTDGETWTQVPDGSEVDVSDDSADADSVGTIEATTCGSTVATAANGDVPTHVCTVTVDSADSGRLAVTVDGVSTQDITANGITRTFAVTFADGEEGMLDGFAADEYSATKTWAAYTLSLDPVDAVNLLNGRDDDPERYHTITATLGSDDPANAPVAGEEIAVTITGSAGVIVAVDNDDDVDPDDPTTFEGTVAPGGLSATCMTAADGTCDIVIFSDTTGDAEVNASYDAKVGVSEPVTVVADTDLAAAGVQGATKTWSSYRVTVTPTQAVNLVDNPHVFTVLVERSTEDGQWLPVVGAVPTVSLDAPTARIVSSTCPDGTVFDDDDTEVDEAGTCLVTVSSDNVEAATLTATYHASHDQVTAAFTDSGGKSWIDHAIDVDPSEAENLVDTDHVFTVSVTTTFPTEAGTTTEGVVGAVPSISLAGPGSITSNTCTAGTVDDDPTTTDVDETGTCLVTIRSSAPGASTLTATYGGTAADDDEVRNHTDSGSKLWVDYALVIDPELANNTVGDPHTFTATLTVDTGNGPVAAVGEALQFTVDGVGEVTGGDVDDALACVTDEAGECDITINSTEVGTTDVAVSHDAVVGGTSRTYGPVQGTKNWVDIDLVKTAVVGSGFGDGDLVADPDTGLPTLFFTSTDRAPKTAVFEYMITNTGPVALQDVVLTDDRLGTVVALADGVTLEPGASTTVRARERFSYDDAAGGLESIIVNVGVVTANDGEGNDVSDTDDAAITLIAQQSSILIDLQKDVVVDAGDVETDDGMPTVTWSQDELEANESKVVRYAFTVTNVGPAPIVDVELTDPMISDQPIIAAADGVTLQPGASTTVEVDHTLTADEAFPDGPTAGEVPNVATVRGANETRDAFDQDSDDAIVFVQVVFSETVRPQKEPPLPATGLQDGGLLPLSVLLISVGAAILWLDRRRDPVA